MTDRELHTFDDELHQRDPRFLRVLSANADEGLGEYELRTATGATGRATFTFCCQHRRVQSPRFDDATRARLATAAIRAAREQQSPELKFENEMKATRFAAIEREAAARAAEVAEVPRMTAAAEAELAKYRAPNSYEEPLRKMKEGRS
jgi:hypothetical protein